MKSERMTLIAGLSLLVPAVLWLFSKNDPCCAGADFLCMESGTISRKQQHTQEVVPSIGDGHAAQRSLVCYRLERRDGLSG